MAYTHTPEKITDLHSNEVFVFGSNEAGTHGGGAAKDAHELFGAKIGEGYGYHRNKVGKKYYSTYAIPTKDYDIKTLPLEEIGHNIGMFLAWAKVTPQMIYLVTPIGCGLAGYKAEDIAPFFKERSPNVILPKSFLNVLKIK